jgi:hypothetical protein
MSGRASSDSQTVPLSRLRALLARPRGQRRMEALLAADDPEAAVAALPASELYQIIADVGLGEAGELVALATPEQLRGCLDIEIWDRDHLQTEALTPWLRALVEAGYEKVGEVWEKLDPELTALTLQRFTRIYDLTLEEAPPDNPEGPLLQTPDTFFVVEILAEDDDTVHLVQRLLDDLYRADPTGVLTRHALMAARSEPTAELEDMSYRWRAGRMADLGYVDYYEALEVFRPLDAASVRIGEGTEDRFDRPEASDPDDPEEAASAFGLMPRPVAEGVLGASFLARALDHVHVDQLGDADEIARLETAIVVLVNNVLAATRVPPADAEAVKRGAQQAASTVSIGLEALSHGDLDRAAQALRSVSLTRLHRLGHTVILRLARMARALAPRAVAAGEPDGSVLAALLRPRPWYATVLDSPPGMDARPFASMDDVRRVAEALTRLALRIAAVDALGVDLLALAERPAPRPTLDDYVRTALVRAALGQSFAATPLEPSDVLTLCRTSLEQGRLSAAARENAARSVLASLDRAQVTAGRHLLPGMLDAWLADIDERVGALPTDRPPDPRFLDGFVWAG